MLNRGEIEGRLDSYYYKREFLLLAEKLKSLPIEFQKLRFLSNKIFSGITPLSKGDDYVESNTGIPFIRSGDFTEHNQIDFDSLIYLSRKIHEKEMRSSQLKFGDLLIAIVGATIGKVGVYSYEREANINQAVCAVRLKPNFNSFFIQTFLFTSIGQKLLDRLKRPVARANINLEEIGTLLIPVLDLEKQQKIVDFISSAYAEKKAKEAEAREKLASVDNLVLDALGITLPDAEENTLAKRIFFTKSSDITGSRFDTFFHTNYYKTIEKIISNSKSQFLPLKKVTTKITDGSHYSPPSAKDLPKKYVTVRDINTYGEINFDNCYSVAEEDFELLEKTGCRPDIGDVLFSKDGTIGKTHTVKETNDFVILSSLAILRPNTNLVNSKYLEYILKTELVISLIKRLMGGSALQRIILQNLKELKIPIPPPEVQKEIAEQVEAIYAEAKLLREQGAEILKNAKAEVERMILGDD